jgi:hypothetical protein
MTRKAHAFGKTALKDSSAVFIQAAAVARTPLALPTRQHVKVSVITDGGSSLPEVIFDGKSVTLNNSGNGDARTIAGQLLTWMKVFETREQRSMRRAVVDYSNPIILGMYMAVEAAVARRRVLVDEGWRLHEYYETAASFDKGYIGTDKCARRISNAMRCLRYGAITHDPVVNEVLDDFAYRIFRRPGRYETALEIIERLIERSGKGEDKGNGRDQGQNQGHVPGKGNEPGVEDGEAGAPNGKGGNKGDIARKELDAEGAEQADKSPAGEDALMRKSIEVGRLIEKSIPAPDRISINGGSFGTDSSVAKSNGTTSVATTIEGMSGVMFSLAIHMTMDIRPRTVDALNRDSAAIAKVLQMLLPKPTGDRLQDSRFRRSGALDDLRLADLPLYASEPHPPVFMSREMMRDPNARTQAVFLYDVSGSMRNVLWNSQYLMARGIQHALAEGRINQAHYAFNDSLYRLPCAGHMPPSDGGTNLANAVCGIGKDLMAGDASLPRLLFVFTDAQLASDDVSLCRERLLFLRRTMGVTTYATIFGNCGNQDIVKSLFPEHVVIRCFDPVAAARTVGDMLSSAIENLRHESMRGMRQ